MPCGEHCPLCDDDIEDEYHGFFNCSRVQAIWNESGIAREVHHVASHALSLNDLFFTLFEQLSHEHRIRLALIFWIIWKRRNENLWEGE